MASQGSRRTGVAALAILGLVAVVAVAGGAAMDGEPSGEAILNETADRYANAASVVGTADVTVSNGTTSTTAVVEFAAEGNKSRVVVKRDNRTYRAGTNGTVAWYVAPNRTAAWELDALRERADDPPEPGALAEAYRNVSIENVRSGTDDGTAAHVLRVTHENDSDEGKATLWIAKNDSRLLRVEATDGTNRTVVDYRETRFNVSVHDSTFEPPSDRLAVTSFDRYATFASAQSNTSLDLPRLNASFREAGVFEGTDGTHAAQRYRAGGDNVTLVSTTRALPFDRANATRVTVNGHAANVTTVRGTAVVYWRSGNVTTAVAVEASTDRALELAERVEE